jgi:hypothetical protein
MLVLINQALSKVQFCFNVIRTQISKVLYGAFIQY